MMSSLPDRLNTAGVALVLSRSRRWVNILDANGQELRGKATAETEEVTVGDYVEISRENDQIMIESIQERTSFLSRTYGRTTRRIAANLDHLYVVTAPPPLFNPSFLDRVLTASRHQSIPSTILVNKIDLSKSENPEWLEIYRSLSIDLLCLSAKQGGEGLEQFQKRLSDPQDSIVVLCGVSGVGKSTLLNALIPDAARRTGEVSDRTGQGKQTTSQAEAYRLSRSGQSDLFIVDLPGIQNFGITGLDPREVEATFPEFEESKASCEYIDCMHLAEPVCGVKSGVAAGVIHPSRYESYREMLEEIEAAREY